MVSGELSVDCLILSLRLRCDDNPLTAYANILQCEVLRDIDPFLDAERKLTSLVTDVGGPNGAGPRRHISYRIPAVDVGGRSESRTDNHHVRRRERLAGLRILHAS